MRIIATTQDFGFGPTSMLNRAISLVPEKFHVDAYIPEHLVGVLSRRPNVTIHPKSIGPKDIAALGGDYDAALVTCDYDLASAMHGTVKKVVVFDMLFWFWPKIHSVVSKDILVIAQNFYGVQDRAKLYEAVHVVGPLLPPQTKRYIPVRERDKNILINLGGFSSPYNADDEAACYIELIGPALNEIMRLDYKVSVVGGSTALRALNQVLSGGHGQVCLLPHDRVLENISKAALYFTIPGLGSIYESFLSGTPAFFLPPTNLTQHLQLKALTEKVEYPWSVPFCSPDLDCCEEEYIPSIYKYYRENTRQLAGSIKAACMRFVHQSAADKQSVVDAALAMVDRFGGPGEPSARKAMEEFLL